MSDQVPGGPPPGPPTPPAPPPGASAPVPPPQTGPGMAPPPGAMPPPPGGMAPPPGGMAPPPGGMAPPPGGMAPPPGYGAPGMATGYKPKPSTPGIAVAGFIMSLVGFFVFAIVLCPIGWILSAKGRKQAKAIGAPTGLATAGIWIGVIGTIFAVLGLILFIILLATGDWEWDTTTTTYTILPFLF
jgi:hypothetical protein